MRGIEDAEEMESPPGSPWWRLVFAVSLLVFCAALAWLLVAG
jgi:hypothetical protein